MSTLCLDLVYRSGGG